MSGPFSRPRYLLFALVFAGCLAYLLIMGAGRVVREVLRAVGV